MNKRLKNILVQLAFGPTTVFVRDWNGGSVKISIHLMADDYMDISTSWDEIEERINSKNLDMVLDKLNKEN